jgi:poly(3-hydroxybutyrate) depolymerase
MSVYDLEQGDHWLAVTADGERRAFRVYVPGGADRSLAPVLAFDGVTLFNRQGSMGSINGLDAASERYKFVAIYPMPKARYFGILAGWNTPGGFLDCRPGYDDVEYVRAILTSLGAPKAYAVGFSAGGQFAHVLAGRLPGTILGVVSVSGTWQATEPRPARGTAAVIIHGESDPVLPYRGGSSFRTCLLAFLGNRNVRRSRPDLQVGVYAEANGYGAEARVEETPIYVKRSFGADPEVPVVEYLVRPPHGGHTYHGRKIGAGAESLLSRAHGRPLSEDVFSINDVFAQCFGLRRTTSASASSASRCRARRPPSASV